MRSKSSHSLLLERYDRDVVTDTVDDAIYSPRRSIGAVIFAPDDFRLPLFRPSSCLYAVLARPRKRHVSRSRVIVLRFPEVRFSCRNGYLAYLLLFLSDIFEMSVFASESAPYFRMLS